MVAHCGLTLVRLPWSSLEDPAFPPRAFGIAAFNRKPTQTRTTDTGIRLVRLRKGVIRG